MNRTAVVLVSQVSELLISQTQCSAQKVYMSFYGDHSVDDAENAVDIERPRPRPPRRAARPPAPGPAAVVLWHVGRVQLSIYLKPYDSRYFLLDRFT